ncbi:hypothetical protein Tco_0655360 [Tanacetum coccineum]|uniref:Tf2-1-like SH3-like domain-containing protein n=1 Tax=Tanacetum coccineum TaxID=301880 RepID=A0ABQ4X5Y3_9ASTR
MEPVPQWRSWLPCYGRFADCDMHESSRTSKCIGLLGKQDTRREVGNNHYGILSRSIKSLKALTPIWVIVTDSQSFDLHNNESDDPFGQTRIDCHLEASGYKFGYEYAYHPQKRAKERTIQTLEDMLRALCDDFGKVSPWKGVVRFGKRGKLNPRYVDPFKVIERVGEWLKLELPDELSRVHNTNSGREVKRLKRSRIMVKRSMELHERSGVPWEREDQFKKNIYPSSKTHRRKCAL